MLVANYLLWFWVPAFSLLAQTSRARFMYLAVTTFTATIICVFQDVTLNKDRETYVYLINEIASGGSIRLEPGFTILSSFLARSSSGAMFETLFFLLVAIVSISLKMSLLAKYGGVLFGSMMAYFSYYFLAYDMTAIRAGLAIGLLYFSWMAWIEGQRTSYFFLGLLATAFHLSSLVFIVAPWILSLSRPWRWLGFLSFLVAFALLGLVFDQWFLELMSLVIQLSGMEKPAEYLYLVNEGVFTTINFMRIIPHLLLLTLYGSRRSLWCDNIVTVMLVRLYMVGILVFLALSPIPVFAYRVSDLFLFAGVLLVGRLRRLLAPALYYPFVITYTAAFIFYTLQWSPLFAVVA